MSTIMDSSWVLPETLAADFSPFTCNNNQQGSDVRNTNRQRAGHRDVQVTGTAEVCSPADRVSVRVSVGNIKESVDEVTNSVSRRLQYILQALRQHMVRDQDTTVRKFLQRESELYRMDAEVTITLSDFDKMERICSVLLEKLDKSVHVESPRFYHSAECLNELRQRACVSAVESAQQKASRVSQLLGQSLGPPLLVREEETREWRSVDEEGEGRGEGAAAVSHLPRIPTITCFSRATVSFSLGNRKKR